MSPSEIESANAKQAKLRSETSALAKVARDAAESIVAIVDEHPSDAFGIAMRAGELVDAAIAIMAKAERLYELHSLPYAVDGAKVSP